MVVDAALALARHTRSKAGEISADVDATGNTNQTDVPADKQSSEAHKEPSKASPSLLLLLCFLSGAAKAFGVCSSVLGSWPVGWMIMVVGPYSGSELWVPLAAAGAFRLVFTFCLLMHRALEDGKVEAMEVAGIVASFSARAFVTANALCPQPIFITYLGGSFSIGDAARVGHLRLGRWLWRLSLDWTVWSLGLWALAAAAGLLLLRSMQFPGSRYWTYLQGARTLCMAAAVSIAWAAAAARTREVALRVVFGSVADLPTRMPDWLLQGRQELSLFALYPGTHGPAATLATHAIVLGDALMSNPAVPGGVGVLGAGLVGGGLAYAGVVPTNGFWLAATAWAALAVMTALIPEVRMPYACDICTFPYAICHMPYAHSRGAYAICACHASMPFTESSERA